jgi:hypothetical protein
MTEYELADAFMTWNTMLESTTERYISLLFAFLVTAHLVSARLKPLIVAIVISLYSYMSLRYAFFYINVVDDQVALAAKITARRLTPGSDLDWLTISPTIANVFYSQGVALFLSYLASLVFFFYTRRSTHMKE